MTDIVREGRPVYKSGYQDYLAYYTGTSWRFEDAGVYVDAEVGDIFDTPPSGGEYRLFNNVLLDDLQVICCQDTGAPTKTPSAAPTTPEPTGNPVTSLPTHLPTYTAPSNTPTETPITS